MTTPHTAFLRNFLIAMLYVALFALATPAYAASGNKVVDATILYTITYSVTAKGTDIHMPIIATRGVSTPNSVGFNMLRNDTEVATEGKANGIVLSDASIDDTLQYLIPAGTTERFQLFVIYTNDDFPYDTPYSVKLHKTLFGVTEAKVKMVNTSAAMKFTVSVKK